MIVRREGLRSGREGDREWLYYSDTGALTQYGAYVETLQPGAGSSEKHWHEKEDEFLYVLAGDVTVLEDDGEAVLHPGDAACWPAGKPVAHTVTNRSGAPCTYLIVGTRVTHDACHYPQGALIEPRPFHGTIASAATDGDAPSATAWPGRMCWRVGTVGVWIIGPDASHQ